MRLSATHIVVAGTVDTVCGCVPLGHNCAVALYCVHRHCAVVVHSAVDSSTLKKVPVLEFALMLLNDQASVAAVLAGLYVHPVGISFAPIPLLALANLAPMHSAGEVMS